MKQRNRGIRLTILLGVLLFSGLSHGQLPMIVDDNIISYQIDSKTSKNDLLTAIEAWKATYSVDIKIDRFEVKRDKLAVIDLIISRGGQQLDRLNYANNFGIQDHIISWNIDSKNVVVSKGKLPSKTALVNNRRSSSSDDDKTLVKSLNQMNMINEERSLATAASDRGQYVIFNGDYYTYYIKDDKTVIVDPNYRSIMLLDKPLKQDDSQPKNGKTVLNNKSYNYNCSSNILTVTDSNGARVNQYGVVVD
ncbi:hypothetical protein [Nonlabens ponticola]|uniref:Uncharacterized protein n=1 Tax=Nonlabens ponticola TaxID=2496866 RepID=A0A3S9MXS3_9FLAO|nr:hypothetical protein [Nonlabens ponticola]AZQ43932.1 hypothetical protein EJ995_06685 [Nonlabens ponticola]